MRFCQLPYCVVQLSFLSFHPNVDLNPHLIPNNFFFHLEHNLQCFRRDIAQSQFRKVFNGSLNFFFCSFFETGLKWPWSQTHQHHPGEKGIQVSSVVNTSSADTPDPRHSYNATVLHTEGLLSIEHCENLAKCIKWPKMQNDQPYIRYFFRFCLSHHNRSFCS